MSRFESLSHTTLPRLPHPLGTRSIQEVRDERGRVVVDVWAIPCPIVVESAVVPDIEPTIMPNQGETDPEGGGPQTQGELRVYTRRRKENEETVPLVPSPLFLPISTPETPSPSTADSEYTGDMIPLSTPLTPLLIRRTSRENAGISPDRYGFPHDIVKFVSYSHISHVNGAFIASLDIVSIPKWEAAMLEELEALAKNRTWELVSLPPGKKAVGCE